MAFPLFVFISFAIAAGTAGATAALARSRDRAALVAAFGAFGLLLFHGLGFFRLFVDDAYITLRYSRHLADGIGPVWNPGEHVDGYTSFSWMAILAGMAKLGFDLVVAARSLEIVAIAATFFVLYRLWRLWSNDEPQSGIGHPLVFGVSLLALALCDAVSYWGLSGMETALFMALLTGSAFLYLRERRSSGVPFSALAFAATAMTRPEGVIAAGVTGLFVAVDALRAADRRRALSRAALWVALFAVPFGIYFAWRWSYYGYLLPNTFYAKVGPSSNVFDRGLGYTASATLDYQLLPMFAGIAILFTQARLRWDAAYLFFVTGALLIAVIFEGGDAFGHGRFIAPVLPLVYFGGFAGLATLLPGLSLRTLQSALVLTVVLGSGALLLLRGSNNPFIPADRQAHEDRHALGAWMNEHTPPDFTIAAFAVGSVGFYAHDRAVLDMLGLNDETIAHSKVPQFGKGIAGHEKYNIEYTLADVRPQIIIYGGADPEPITEAQLQADPPALVEARNALFADQRLWEQYDVRSLHLNGKWFNFLQRTDTIAALQAPNLK
jgi:hypothetical protein